MSIYKESLPGIKGKEAIDLIVEVLLEEGVDNKVIISMFFLSRGSLNRKITICHKSLFEQRLREICRENRYEMERGNCRKVADEILDLFYDDPKNKIRVFIKNNLSYILISLSIIIPVELLLKVLLY